MRIKVELYVDVDPATWRETNGMNGASASEVREDVRSFVFHAVQQLPMMEDTEAEVLRTGR
jgi:hypothetical protein